MKLFRKIVEVKEPASGDYVGVATGQENLIIPNVSSCLAIVFQLKNQITIGGHVPMIWGKNDTFQLSANADKVLDAMLQVTRATPSLVVFIGDESNWNDPNSPFGSEIVNSLLMRKGLRNTPCVFYDKEKIANANVRIARLFC
ncbi:hypothetical protein [Legionella brunensis]|uniref:Uncharacterized protein n=1 Tax=Legionella brunensis TaxID=29422 RepID=A0A0W0SM34_9GAMM|nr:hypothetical protein [Legionella brunensis]KTC84466.1 hypothetical protein Lbru_1334 [Legionella brunensis]